MDPARAEGSRRGEPNGSGRQQQAIRSSNSLEAGPSGTESTSSYQDADFQQDVYMRHSISRRDIFHDALAYFCREAAPFIL